MSLKIEFVYDVDCPNIQATRTNLLRALSLNGIPASWQEWDQKSPDAPPYVKHYGSPTILVNGKDVGGEKPNPLSVNSCRVYSSLSNEKSGVPSVELIQKSFTGLAPVTSSRNRASLFGTIAVGPSVGAALLAEAACPLCYPAIAGLLSLIGLGFLFQGTYLMVLTVTFLGVAMFGLFYRARFRWGYRPFALGLIGSILLVIGKFSFESNPVFYVGVTVLSIATIWNLIPKRSEITKSSCSACAPGERETMA